MKKYILIPVYLVFLCILLGLSWEGELNPTEFDKWEIIKILHQDSWFVYVLAKNRDELSPIRLASFAYRKADKQLVEYAYFKLGELYSFKWHEDTDEYKRTKMQKWEIKRCFNCHQDELKKKQKKKEV